MENRKISIIVAAYNIEAYLPRCLDSLLAQSYPNLEIIVVDDGSTDGTGAICDKYKTKDFRITVIHQLNQGLSGARNTGLALAAGDYIGYVDGDDWIEPDMYRAMLEACEEECAQLAVCAYRQIGNEKEEKKQFTGERYILTKENALEIYISDNQPYHIYNSVWSKLFRKDIIEGMQFPVGKKSEDIMYTTRAMVNAEKCVFLDTPYYNYVVDRADSIMNNKLHERRFNDEIPFWKEQIVFLKDKGFETLSEKAFYFFYRRMLIYFIEFKDKKMKMSAGMMAALLQGEKENIKIIYGKDFVKVGDKARINLFLMNPTLFYYTVKLYEKFVIPLRQ
jgi:glycosyltransferase involved in cell wall biosynthesis